MSVRATSWTIFLLLCALCWPGLSSSDDSSEPDPIDPDVSEPRPWFSEFEDGNAPKGIVDLAHIGKEFQKTERFKSWWYRYQLINNPENPVPYRDLFLMRVDAWEQIEKLVRVPETLSRGTGGAATTPWASIGPSPTQNWIDTTQNVTGRMVDIAVHPTLSATWLVAATGGGVWLTTNTGGTWTAKTDGQATLAVGAVAFAPGTPNTIYVGTGSYVDFGGVGVLKSTDGGNSWQLLATATFSGDQFHDIRVHPTNANIVVAATGTGIYRSTDGGVTWSRRVTGTATDLEVDPTNFNRQYAGIAEPDTADGLYRSTDGGVNWGSPLTGPWGKTNSDDVGRVEIAIAPSNVNVLYVSMQNPGDNGNLKGLWRTGNAWATPPTWTAAIATSVTNSEGNVNQSYCSSQCDFSNDLAVKSSDANVLFTGGLRLYKCIYSAGTNSCSWTDISRGEQNSGIHDDEMALAISGSRLIVANDGGVFSTTNDGSTWVKHNTDLAVARFYHGSLHPVTANIIQGGQHDTGTSRRPSTGGNTWDYAKAAGDGGDNFFSPFNPDTKWMLSTGPLGLVRFTSGGAAQCNVGESIPDTNGVAFIGTVEVCPGNEDVVLAGTDNVWITSEAFSGICMLPSHPAWTKACAADLPDHGEMGQAVQAIGFAAADNACNTFAFGADNGKLRITTNGGGNCSDLDPGGQVPAAPITDIALHPCFSKSPSQAVLDYETAYVTLGGGGTPHVYKSTTALSTKNWSDVTPVDGGGVPIDIANKTIVLDPLALGHVYLGTELGLWTSADAGASWTHVSVASGVPYVPIYDLQINDRTNEVVAFTHGRSTYKLDLNRCAGDCDGNGEVGIGELQVMQNIQLGSNDICRCRVGDTDHDGAVGLGEVQVASNNLFNGCP